MVNFFLIGIKGTGLCSLACFLHKCGCFVEGVDTRQVFHTDEILTKHNIIYFENIYEFSLKNYKKKFDYIVYSTAYDETTVNALKEAKELGISVYSYPQLLGELSKQFNSIGIAGVHGKTTTTAFAGILFNIVGLKPNVIVGASVKDFSDESVLTGDSNILIAETCEYRRNFLNFLPNMIIITNINYEHVDYFKNYSDLESAFLEYIFRLKIGGTLIYNSDDKNLLELIKKVKRSDIRIISYGCNDSANYKITNIYISNNLYYFDFLGLTNIPLKSPLKHNIFNFSASLLSLMVFLNELGRNIGDFEDEIKTSSSEYKGVKRRLELIRESNGIMYLDDYGHHPKEIESTINSLRIFYKNRRIILDFMPHTYTRTEVLIEDFVESLKGADIVILHDIYSSAREQLSLDLLSNELYSKLKKLHSATFYFKTIEASVCFVQNIVKEDDIFITMGAGDNFRIHDYLRGM